MWDTNDEGEMAYERRLRVLFRLLRDEEATAAPPFAPQAGPTDVPPGSWWKRGYGAVAISLGLTLAVALTLSLRPAQPGAEALYGDVMAASTLQTDPFLLASQMALPGGPAVSQGGGWERTGGDPAPDNN